MKPVARKVPSGSHGLSLERFAHAKSSTYDKKKRKEREFALNAKKVNKYRKLKQRLAQAGRLQPNLPKLEEDEEEQHEPSSRKKRSGRTDLDMSRLLARAGPTPEGASGGSGDDDMVGAESSDDEEQEAQRLAARQAGAASTSGRQHADPGRPPLHAGSGGVSQGAQQSRPSTFAPAEAPVSGPQQQRRMKEGAAPAKAAHAEQDVMETGDEPEEGSGKVEKRSKLSKHKAPSQLQRIAARVQEQKNAAAEAREKRRREIEEHRERVAAAEKERKRASKLLRKRTRQGQPVMRFRLDRLLGQLQAEQA